MPQKVILDVDTGCDDAVAMLLAGHHPALELVAALPVHGNAPLADTLENTLRLLSAGKLEHVPVYVGAENPLIGPVIAGHGDQIVKLPFENKGIKPQPQHAVNYLIEYYMSGKGLNTIYMPVGPLTNLALALRIEPRLAKKIPSIVTMGGAYLLGNTNPSAEFNILADPEAAQIAYSAGIPIRMVGLEVCELADIEPKDSDAVRANGTPWASAAADIIDIVIGLQSKWLGKPSALIYDAVAVATVVEPGIMQTKPMHVEIELTGTHTRGRTVADGRLRTGPANVDVGVGFNRARFLEILREGLK